MRAEADLVTNSYLMSVSLSTLAGVVHATSLKKKLLGITRASLWCLHVVF
jgi:hypothetical protein